jgi:hypothetical protein
MDYFNMYQIQRVESALLSQRAHRAYNQMPAQEVGLFERFVASLLALFVKQPKPVVVPVRANRTY